jgi:hypothetical protein
MVRLLAKGLLVSMSVAGGLLALSENNVLAGDCRGDCCAPPPPVEVVLCVKDPCTCCTYEVSVCLPACCANEVPCIRWRNGIFGRRVATYAWECCGHAVDIVITKHGRVKVRG